MKRNAFTLLELLAVITILGIIAVLISTTSIRLINNSKKSLYEEQVNTIEEAAKKWAIANTGEMPMDSSDEAKVDIIKLNTDGYLDSDQLTDPRDNTKLCGHVKITYNDNNNQYNYTFVKATC